MQHLVGRLTSLDPEAGDILRVVSYFDVLIARGAGVDGLLRGAALLSGTVAGAQVRGRITRRDPDGGSPPHDAAARHSAEQRGASWTVWLERPTDPTPRDAIIVERLAVGVQALEARRNPENVVDLVVDAARPVEERMVALARLGIAPGRPLAGAGQPGHRTRRTKTSSRCLASIVTPRRFCSRSTNATASVRPQPDWPCITPHSKRATGA